MEAEELKEKVIEALHEIYDPEIPVDIYELGLIYEVEILPINNVQIVMTLTAPSCPSARGRSSSTRQRPAHRPPSSRPPAGCRAR